MGTDWMEKGYIHLKDDLKNDELAGYLAGANVVIADYREASL